ncbi:hypothetical protein GMDG_02950 [Pseudogymnoascus destructans 20631-21]|uniref:Uncharacterized protein n=1 Tax=Pseudogymnoascus destructans (strain ATCC MYA-4855 / 20631-21) TaxID=658429 RepID=L8G644_PSED2|nr:hypothetical protein GMDG_02950 [Pseudogymnoascus destructans 20631-21]
MDSNAGIEREALAALVILILAMTVIVQDEEDKRRNRAVLHAQHWQTRLQARRQLEELSDIEAHEVFQFSLTEILYGLVVLLQPLSLRFALLAPVLLFLGSG